jgi:hypothetical protein
MRAGEKKKGLEAIKAKSRKMRQAGRKHTTACQSAALDVADRIALIIFVFAFQSACEEFIASCQFVYLR